MSVAPLQLLKSEFNPLVYVFLDNATDKLVVGALYTGTTGTTPTDAYFAKGAILLQATDGTFYQNSAADGATPTWVQFTATVPGANTITTAMLQALSITAAKLAADSVETAKILDGAVTTAKIADNSVTGAKIALASQATGDIMYYNGTDWVRLAVGTNGQVLTLAGGVPTWA